MAGITANCTMSVDPFTKAKLGIDEYLNLISMYKNLKLLVEKGLHPDYPQVSNLTIRDQHLEREQDILDQLSDSRHEGYELFNLEDWAMTL